MLNLVVSILTKIWSLISSILFGEQNDDQPPGSNKPKVAVIGAGFSGMCAAIQLRKQLGIKAQVFEASAQIGGTWLANTYPGCACDVPSHLYSYSFELNPGWSHTYSPQPEILKYLRHVASKYKILDQTLVNTEVIRGTWIEGQNQWKLDYKTRTSAADDDEPKVQTDYYDFVFGALGPLRVANIPEQFKAFKGTIVHTTYWDHTIDFTDKKIAVIGSGASAVQAIPELQKVASKIISYQRTPSWIVGRTQLAYPGWMKKLFQIFPPLMLLQRLILYLIHEAVFPIVFKDRTTRLAKFAQAFVARDMRKRLKKLGRSDLIPVLVPGYPLGCKRICRSENYLEALCQNNVSVKKGSIAEVKGHSIRHEDGSEEEVDILVLATGFDVEGGLGQLEVFGRDGVSLNKKWKEEYPTTLQTVNINGFPNLFVLLGPNSGLGHNSIILVIEIQVNYAIRSIRHVMNEGIGALEARQDSAEKDVANILTHLKNSTWAGSCSSYYKNDKGELYALWSGTVASFWYKMQTANYGQDFVQHPKRTPRHPQLHA